MSVTDLLFHLLQRLGEDGQIVITKDKYVPWLIFHTSGKYRPEETDTKSKTSVFTVADQYTLNVIASKNANDSDCLLKDLLLAADSKYQGFLAKERLR